MHRATCLLLVLLVAMRSGVAEEGGLHVIATECHDAGRIDRQLFGRSGRQGDPGSYETFLSMEDELLRLDESVDAAPTSESLAKQDGFARQFNLGVAYYSGRSFTKSHGGVR